MRLVISIVLMVCSASTASIGGRALRSNSAGQQEERRQEAGDERGDQRPLRALALASLEQELPAEAAAAAAAANSAPVAPVQKRAWTPRLLGQRARSASKRDEVMRLLLEELPTLDIDIPSGPRSAQQQQQQQQQVAANEQTATNLGPASGRLRGRSTFVLGANGAGQQTNQVQSASSLQISPGLLGIEGNVNSFSKANRHVPCFFNAITCF